MAIIEGPESEETEDIIKNIDVDTEISVSRLRKRIRQLEAEVKDLQAMRDLLESMTSIQTPNIHGHPRNQWNNDRYYRDGDSGLAPWDTIGQGGGGTFTIDSTSAETAFPPYSYTTT